MKWSNWKFPCRIKIVAVLCVLLVPLYALASSGYLSNALINGQQVQRWNDTNTTISVTIKPGTGLTGWSPDMIGLVKSAFTEWEKALGSRYRFVYTNDPAQTDIMVTWARRSYGTQVGHQQIQYEGNTLVNADVTIALLAPNGQYLDKVAIRSVAVHEIGHALGIRGHSETPGDIMYPSLQYNVTHLSANDIATIRALYRLKPDITNPKGVHLMMYRQYSYYTRLGYDAFKRKDFKLAFDYFLKAKGYYSHDDKIAYYLGISALNLKKYDDALSHLEKAAIARNEMQMDSMFLLGSAHTMKCSEGVQAGQLAPAKAHLERARQLYQAISVSPKANPDLKKRSNNQLAKLKAIKL